MKEFCHGDFGRTKPSLADLVMLLEESDCGKTEFLGCDILQLDVLSLTEV